MNKKTNGTRVEFWIDLSLKDKIFSDKIQKQAKLNRKLTWSEYFKIVFGFDKLDKEDKPNKEINKTSGGFRVS